jgi:hypothetical protein
MGIDAKGGDTSQMIFLKSLLGGIWGYVIAAALSAALAVGATWYIVGTSKDLTISNLKLAQSHSETVSVSASLAQLQSFIARMNIADKNYADTLDNIDKQFAGVKDALAHVKISVPLPPDCRPDIGRLRVLQSAVDKANRSATTAH